VLLGVAGRQRERRREGGERERKGPRGGWGMGDSEKYDIYTGIMSCRILPIYIPHIYILHTDTYTNGIL